MKRQPHISPLEQLFGSALRVRLLRLFLDRPLDAWDTRTIQTRLRVHRIPLTRELENLCSFGILTCDARGDERGAVYRTHTNALLYPELKSLFLKARLLIERALVQEIERIGHVRYLLLAGFFVGDPDAPTDLFIVGKINRKKIGNLMKRFERELGREIRYTVMSKNEFKYRHDITDRFLYHLLENPKKIVVIDTLVIASATRV
ncbi:hypothetical protein HY624_03295 [Candidatus Uhrbacteria bacterium]|nr:hypothetical protein [Candidatus Uhrbacteria bacterium]